MCTRASVGQREPYEPQRAMVVLPRDPWTAVVAKGNQEPSYVFWKAFENNHGSKAMFSSTSAPNPSMWVWRGGRGASTPRCVFSHDDTDFRSLLGKCGHVVMPDMFCANFCAWRSLGLFLVLQTTTHESSQSSHAALSRPPAGR